MLLNEPNVITKLDGDISILYCPRCGGTNLHHGPIAVYERYGEDSETSFKTTVFNKDVEQDVVRSKSSLNPSSRRDGIVIVFSCEECSQGEDILELTIAQHKGETHLAWRYLQES